MNWFSLISVNSGDVGSGYGIGNADLDPGRASKRGVGGVFGLGNPENDPARPSERACGIRNTDFDPRRASKRGAGGVFGLGNPENDPASPSEKAAGVKLEYYPQKGPAKYKGIGTNQNLNGALHVVLYMLKQVSVNRFNELKEQIENLIKEYSKYPKIAEILQNVSGLAIIL